MHKEDFKPLSVEEERTGWNKTDNFISLSEPSCLSAFVAEFVAEIIRFAVIEKLHPHVLAIHAIVVKIIKNLRPIVVVEPVETWNLDAFTLSIAINNIDQMINICYT